MLDIHKLYPDLPFPQVIERKKKKDCVGGQIRLASLMSLNLSSSSGDTCDP